MWAANNQAAIDPKFMGTAFLDKFPYFFQRLEDGSCPPEFTTMLDRDKHQHPDRYSDMLGDDAVRARRVLPWCFASHPMSVGVFASGGHLVAIAYATLIRVRRHQRLQAPNDTEASLTGVNLSYAVHSDYEGKGLALLASCLVIKAASQQWPTLDHRHTVNIQTKTNNAPSMALAERLGASVCPEADFSYIHPEKGIRQYCGFRGFWPDTVAHCNTCLSKFLVLSDFEEDDTSFSNDSPGITP